MKLSRYDKADICLAAIFFGVICIVMALGVQTVVGQPMWEFVRYSIATVGVVCLAYGAWRLHRAATGKHPFPDDTRVELFQYKDGMGGERR
jgi:hypothetical protein